MNPTTLKEKLTTLGKITGGDSTTIDKAESIVTLLKGIDPRIDKKLTTLTKSLSTLRNLQEGNVIELSAENLPQDSEEEKKRKKAIIFFIKGIKELKSEIEQVHKEFDAKSRGEQTSAETAGKITAFAKGPFGILTIAAITTVLGFTLVRGRTNQNPPLTAQSSPTPLAVATPTPIISPSPTPQESPVAKTKTKVISYNDKKIPLDQLEVRTGPDCTSSPEEAPHYHAKNNQFVQATDGTIIPDPGSCAFGKVDKVQVEEIETSSNTDPSLF